MTPSTPEAGGRGGLPSAALRLLRPIASSTLTEDTSGSERRPHMNGRYGIIWTVVGILLIIALLIYIF
jgi:hypothetical protein